MTEWPNFSSKCDNAEYVLGDLDDETPTSSCEEMSPCQKLAANAPELDQEGLHKFEKNAINKIMAIQSEVKKIKEEILSTEKEVLEREFRKYDDILVQKTISLDNIETRGIESIKESRREAVIFVQECLKLLDSKIK